MEQMMRKGLPTVALVGMAVMAVPALLAAQSAGQDVTFARDVAPILQENCQVCHRPGNIGPMSLLTYEEARPWGPMLKEMAQSGRMPPWPIDQTVGTQEFKNDISLSKEEIEAIVTWVDSGAPLGDPADLPPAVEWPDYAEYWRYAERFNRPPDLVIASPPYTVIADGMDQWPTPRVEITGDMISGDRWVQAVELRPGTPDTRYVFHHANPRVINRDEGGAMDEGSPLSRQFGASRFAPELVQSAVGTEGFIYPADTGKLLREGDIIQYAMHMFPIERDIEAVLEVGLWFYPEGEAPKFSTPGEVQFGYERLQGMENNALILPPHSKVMYKGSFEVVENARIHSVRGHMHTRGAYQMVEVIYPDGRYEFLNKLNWDHGWHTSFIYEDHVAPLWPKGTRVIVTSVFDNTADNRYNPDPDQWVLGGARTADEMHNIRFGITYFENEEDFQDLKREQERIREQLAADRE